MLDTAIKVFLIVTTVVVGGIGVFVFGSVAVEIIRDWKDKKGE